MNVVLDSNVLYGDYILESAPMRTLALYLARAPARLLIPQVVIEEAVRHFTEGLLEATSSLPRARHLAKILGISLPELPDPKTASKTYRAALQTRLAGLNATILPLPSPSIEELLQRDIQVRSPFDRTGRGFRDTLIWHSILDFLGTDSSTTILVSQDGDFEESPKDKASPARLHPDLLSDADAASIPADVIGIRRTLHEFNEEFAKSFALDVYSEGEPLQGSFAAALDAERILEYYGEAAATEIHDHIGFILPLGLGYADSVTFLRMPENVKLLEALDLGDSVVQAVIRAFLLFDVELHLPEETYPRIIEFSARRGFLMGGPTWEPGTHTFYIVLRVPLFANFVAHWDTVRQEGKAFSLLSFGSTEAELNENPISLP